MEEEKTSKIEEFTGPQVNENTNRKRIDSIRKIS